MSAGLYIHVPFCKSRCIYCEFYSQTEISAKKYLRSLYCEAEYYSKAWKDKTFDSVYLGGGTPSLLPGADIINIINKVRNEFNVSHDAEITIECNPDDVNKEFISEIKQAVNRVSIGVQSFNDEVLKFLSRRHDSSTAKNAVALFLEDGINNVSIDLIFGLPGLTVSEWKNQVSLAAGLHVKHISAYMLTMHENTVLYNMYGDKTIFLPDEDECFRQFCSTSEMLSQSGINQYEISNFAVPGYESVHNRKYWEGKPWLGLGPSAHSYIPYKRYANLSDAGLYYNDISRFISSVRVEDLSSSQIFNEYIMNSIRTSAGVSLLELQERHSSYYPNFNKVIKELNNDWYIIENGYLKLTLAGMFVSDYITEKLFI